MTSEARHTLRLVALAAILLFAFLAGKFYIVAGDDGAYIALARAMREGSYCAINIPERLPQIQYPPLFPFLLLPFAHLPSGSIGILRLWTACLALLCVPALAAAARRRDPSLGALAVLPFLLSPLFGEYGSSVMTEVLSIAIAYAVLVRTEDEIDAPGGPARISLVALGLLFSWLLRPAAVALVGAVLLRFLFARRFRTAFAIAGIVAIGMAPWWAWQAAHASDYIRSHILQRDIYTPSAGALAPLEILTVRLPGNAARYVGRIMAETLLPPFFRFVPSALTPLGIAKGLLGVILTIAAVIGFVKRLRVRLDAEAWFVIGSIGMYLIHPVYSDRYLFALLPSLAGYILLAVPSITHRARVAVAWSVILLLGCIVSIETPPPKEDAAYIQAVEWIKEHSEPGDIVLARKSITVWFYAERLSKGYPVTVSLADWDTRARYVIRDAYVIGVPSAERYVDPIVADTAVFSPVWVSDILPDVKIYERHRSGAAS